MNKRWRAKKGGGYFYITHNLCGAWTVDEYYDEDTRLYEAGNYFKTGTEAQEALTLLQETLKEYHQNK